MDAPVRLAEVRFMPERLPQLLRADAQDNRDRIVVAARALFSEAGLDVGMREIARRAEVGPATLYRRFPTRHLLVEEVFAEEVSSCRRIVEEGCANPDPWAGFCSVIEGVSLLNVSNRGFVDAFIAAGPDLEFITAHRIALLRMIGDLAERAKAAGHLRSDFHVDDFVLVVRAERGLAGAPSASRDAAARRFAQLVIDGFRAAPTRT